MSTATAPLSGRNVESNDNVSLEDQLSALLNSSDFSVAAYLNLALRDAAMAEEEHLQQRMTELALQLQMQTQSCHDDIGRIGAELQAILPRCGADMSRIGVGLDGMKIDAAALLASNTGPDEEVSTSMETLSTLHALRSSLTQTKEILEAAASWDTTLASIPPLLAQQNLTEAVAALAKLEAGERALSGMAKGKSDRFESIQKIRQQVQVMLQPQLRHALQNMNTRLSPLQQCVTLYSALDKMDSLKEEYVKNRPGAVHKAWFAYKPPTPSMDNNEMDPATALVTWLPGWYDKVLTLMTEERRQSVSVFGPEMAPEMMTKVLGECFRPILSSFASRLEMVCSPQSLTSPNGSFESICALYEGTLQFLSLVYETVAGSWLDVAESVSSSKAEVSRMAVSLYNDVMAVFLQVASPFAIYQEKFAQLEQVHSGNATAVVAKDIQQAVSSVSASTSAVDKLQDVTDKLKELAPIIFTYADAGLVRFELLNGGYLAMEALSTIDAIVSGHAGELSMAILTLSTSSQSDAMADSFDEQHVHCALEVLKVAGSFRRDLRLFESKTKERMTVLGERMAVHAAHEKELQDASSGSSSTNSFLFPDSLSVVEIDSLLTKAVCDDASGEEGASLSKLQELVNKDAMLFNEANEATTRLANSCHKFVFDVCFAVPRKCLGNMSAMASWREPASEDSFESYGTLPQQYITHVGENMLALVQALEPFASDTEALSLANEVMKGLRNVAVPPWREFVAAAGSPDANVDHVIAALMNGKELADTLFPNHVVHEEEEDVEDDDETNHESTVFCNAWLDVVGLAVTGRLLERIMRIPNLSSKGCEHLAADLTYLINVFSALSVSGHPHPLLSHLAELANMTNEELAEKVAHHGTNEEVEAVIYSAEVRIALMRGISNVRH